jgi:hypothetical protein
MKMLPCSAKKRLFWPINSIKFDAKSLKSL